MYLKILGNMEMQPKAGQAERAEMLDVTQGYISKRMQNLADEGLVRRYARKYILTEQGVEVIKDAKSGGE
jgi:predicted transcriptional regulator